VADVKSDGAGDAEPASACPPVRVLFLPPVATVEPSEYGLLPDGSTPTTTDAIDSAFENGWNAVGQRMWSGGIALVLSYQVGPEASQHNDGHLSQGAVNAVLPFGLNGITAGCTLAGTGSEARYQCFE